MPDASPIFINYRRTKSRDKALILRWILENEFGKGVSFLDDASIPPGQAWRDELKQAVQQCDIVLALIHKDWHKDQDHESGEKSLTQSHDWIRQEIATALDSGTTVVPVLIDQAYLTPRGADLQRNDLPKDEWMPSDIHKLFSGQTFRLRFDDLTPESLEKFLEHLKSHLGDHWQSEEPAEGRDNGGYYPGVLQETFPLPSDLAVAPPTSRAPFVGLRPFHREDAKLFYGRSREIYELCFKLVHQHDRLLLLDGYSGTGKSSLLQAGLIPRMEAQGWGVSYARREEDKVDGLPAVLAAKRNELATAEGPRLIILDQVEEVLTNPIHELSGELALLVDALVNALEEDRNLKVILGFRSEYAAHVERQLNQHVERPGFDGNNTIHTLERPGMIEAIRSVTADDNLNGPGKQYHLRFRPSHSLPETIADHLINSKAGYHIAPLLQVNLELLWERCRGDDGVVKITDTAVGDLIDTHEALLDHYVSKIREDVTSAQVDDQRLLELLQFYVEQKPASALRPDHEFEQQFGSDRYAPVLRDACKKLYLLYSKGSGENTITRLSHDSLAEVIDGRYSRLTAEKVVSRGSLAFESLKREIDEQIDTLQYRPALDTLNQMMKVEEQRQELYPYFFELTYFWNEADSGEEREIVLQQWHDSGVFPDSLQINYSLTYTTRESLRDLLKDVDPARYAEMQTRYLAPQQTVMVDIEAGEFQMGDAVGDLPESTRPVHRVQLNAFYLGKVPVTWRQYALYLFAIQEAEEIERHAPSWGVHGNHPTINLDWYDAVEYCNWLSTQMGLAPGYEIVRDHSDPGNVSEYDKKKWAVRLIDNASGFRLPTEAEWEYACRAGSTTRYSFGDDEKELADYGWYDENSDEQTQPVGAKKPNAWGLYDMHGNVWEWCHDWLSENYYKKSPGTDPQGPDSGSRRVIRGGSWSNNSWVCRSACRGRSAPESRDDYLGLRMARSSVESSPSESGA